ncbi:hypothetical protein P8936_06995 [Edaphobacter paludis]|uniref:Uncharacterized protein n=1 Tax=Edaphobacter paludis TaxID=3035702 RepID=A0AAU7D2F0_9BACT
MNEKRDVETAELSIWFFCGILMLTYGVVLIATGILEYHNPPPNELLLPWLESLHPTLWWGMVMAVFGGIYTFKFWPKHPLF